LRVDPRVSFLMQHGRSRAQVSVSADTPARACVTEQRKLPGRHGPRRSVVTDSLDGVGEAKWGARAPGILHRPPRRQAGRWMAYASQRLQRVSAAMRPSRAKKISARGWRREGAGAAGRRSAKRVVVGAAVCAPGTRNVADCGELSFVCAHWGQEPDAGAVQAVHLPDSDDAQ